MSQTYFTLTQQMVPHLKAEMQSVLKFEEVAPEPFYGMLHYHMGWVNADLQPEWVQTGKQIRPFLCLISCAAIEGDWQQAIPAAAAIELLHNFSLIHDDIEDASPTRRGRKTVWRLWGKEQAINAGDAMFALSHLALNRLIERDIPPLVVVESLRRFDETCIQLTQGQHADMAFETEPTVPVEAYLRMIQGKTAVLLSLCTELGAKIGGATAEVQHHMAQFGLKLGLAFQVIDDILGIWGDEAQTGKSAATDILTKKKTLPVLYGLANSQPLKTLYTETAVVDSNFVSQAVTYLDDCGAYAFAKDKASQYSNDALTHLEEATPIGKAGEALYELVNMLLDRDY